MSSEVAATDLILPSPGAILSVRTTPIHIVMREPEVSLRIRRARDSDTATIVEFNRLLAKETEDRILDARVLESGVRALLSDPARGMYFLAEEDGEIIGQTMITYEWSDWRNGVFWWIQSVYVRPEQRRKGVFQALFQYIHKTAQDDGTVCGLRLYVDRNNGRAMKTYDTLGMRRSEYQLMEIDFVLSPRDS